PRISGGGPAYRGTGRAPPRSRSAAAVRARRPGRADSATAWPARHARPAGGASPRRYAWAPLLPSGPSHSALDRRCEKTVNAGLAGLSCRLCRFLLARRLLALVRVEDRLAQADILRRHLDHL